MASKSKENRELKNHDEVHDDDICWLRKDWNKNVSFGGKKETYDAVDRVGRRRRHWM